MLRSSVQRRIFKIVVVFFFLGFWFFSLHFCVKCFMETLCILLTTVLPVFSSQFIILRLYNWAFLCEVIVRGSGYFFWGSRVSEHSLLGYSSGNPSLFAGVSLFHS